MHTTVIGGIIAMLFGFSIGFLIYIVNLHFYKINKENEKKYEKINNNCTNIEDKKENVISETKKIINPEEEKILELIKKLDSTTNKNIKKELIKDYIEEIKKEYKEKGKNECEKNKRPVRYHAYFAR